MSLGITIGRLAHFLKDDYLKGVEAIQRDMGVINRLLTENGLPTHTEPRTLSEFRSRSLLDHTAYSWYALLQRAIAFSRQTKKKFVPARKNSAPLEHPLVRAEQNRSRRKSGYSHLVCHSAEGYFVPLDFPEPLFVMPWLLVGGSLGSCQAATRELIAVAPLLDIALKGDRLPDTVAKEINDERASMEPGPLYAERQAWLILFESFRVSIEHGAAVCFH
jgi:hypothetical protein